MIKPEDIKPGDIILHNEMCLAEGYSLQRGMNYRVHGDTSIILMSLRKNAPYADKIEDDGKILIYEGHDAPRISEQDPKSIDQPRYSPKGRLTQNGKFEQAAIEFKGKKREAELVKVYEKIERGIWAYNGTFELRDAWTENINGRQVFRFKLVISDSTLSSRKESLDRIEDLPHNRIIPTSVKYKVWKRDKGKCVLCDKTDNLHFDHIIPFSKGGTSLKAENIQLLCARHNLKKSNKIH